MTPRATEVPWDDIIHSSTFGYSYCKIILDGDGRPADYEFLDANQAFASMIGRDTGEIPGRRVTELVNGIEGDEFDWIDFFGRVALSGDKSEVEEYSRPLDRWFHLSVTSPRRGYFCVLSFDITDKRKAELALIVSEERNRRYLESAPDGIFINDGAGRFVQINPAAAAMLGYSVAELQRLTIADIAPPDIALSTEEKLRHIRERGKDSRKTELVRKSGERIIVMLDSVALPEGQYMAFCKDITEQETIAMAKERYYTAFQAMAQPIIFTSPSGEIIEVNAAFCDMYGFSREETIGSTPNLLNPGKEVYENLGYTEAEYESRFRGLWQCAKDPEKAFWEGVVINRKKDGSLAWVNLVVNSIFGENGELTSIVGLPIDITSTRETEDRNRVLMYRTLAELAELRDDETGNHMRRVGIYARIFAKALGMGDKFCADIELFAPMHDIGKVGILDSILRAPRKLTDGEFEIMKTHTTLGHNIVKGKRGIEMAAEITLSHHERFDGKGYPNGIAGREIPLSAQITSLVDVYDALRSTRPYKEPWTHDAAVEYIVGLSGTQFDPLIVETFSTLHARFASVFDELKD